MMPFPLEFYVLESTSTDHYRDSPPGMMEVSRFIRGEPCWLSQSCSELPKPKKLIFADWTVMSWSFSKILAVTLTLERLLDEGFDLYIFRRGRVAPFLRSDFFLLQHAEFTDEIQPVHAGDIIQAAVEQHGLTYDHIHILDDYWIRRALGQVDTDTFQRALIASDLGVDSSLFELSTRIVEIVSKSMPKPEAIICDVVKTWSCGVSEKDGLMTLRALFPALPALKRCKQLYLGHDSAKELIASGRISLAETILSDFDDLETLDLSVCDDLTDTFLALIVGKIHQLKSLSGSSCGLLELFIEGADLSKKTSEYSFVGLSNLNYLSLRQSKISFKILNQLLVGAPKLEALDLNSTSITDKFIEDIRGFEYIKYLYVNGLTGNLFGLLAISIRLRGIAIHGKQFIYNDFYRMLQVCPVLNEIKLTNCELLGDIFGVDSPIYAQITCLILKHTQINAKNFKQLLTSFIALTRLELIGLSNIEELVTGVGYFEAGSLFNLETLYLCKMSIAPQDLKKILRAATHIKRLILMDCEQFSIDLELRALLERIPDVSIELVSVASSDEDMLNQAVVSHPDSGSDSDSEDWSTELPMVDPRHDASTMRHLIPHSKLRSFEFKGINTTKNQGMIIEKLSQYLTLRGADQGIISKLQGGICLALCHFYKDIRALEWHLIIDMMLAWDGISDHLTRDLDHIFNNLCPYIQRYQLTSGGYPLYYLGEALGSLLSICPPLESIVLNNPWHAIAIRRLADGNAWEVYDPNFVDGVRVVANGELMAIINGSIGSLVSVESMNRRLPPKLGDPQLFIENGGLLSLLKSANIAEMLSQLIHIIDYSLDSLEGVFLRDLDGIPAWIKAICTPELSNYTFVLMHQFIVKHPMDYQGILEDSIEYISPIQRHWFIEKMIQYVALIPHRDARRIADLLISAMRTAPLSSERYEQLFETWVSTELPAQSLERYCLHCLVPSHQKKQLIQLNSTVEVDALIYALQYGAQIAHRPLFYVNSPEDLVCLAPNVVLQADGSGELHRGAGGPLYQFLKMHEGKVPSVLLINYEHFKNEDIVKYNTLLDPDPKVDGIPLPQQMKVIGVMNVNKPNVYQGSDFYSRFDFIENSPVPKELLVLPALPIYAKELGIPKAGAVINLYHAVDWKERLVGRWTLNGDRLFFKEGLLQKAILDAKGAPIEIQNAPWDSPEFQQFWHQAFLRGQVGHGRIPIPAGLILIRSEGYDWTVLKAQDRLVIDSLLCPNANVLNPGRLGDFFYRYECVYSHLIGHPGLIEDKAGQILDVNLTHDLSEDSWAMVLSACEEHRVTLRVHYAPGVLIPAVLGDYPLIAPPEPVAFGRVALTNTVCILSSDIDTTIAQCNSRSEWIVIDVSESQSSDLLGRLNGQLVGAGYPRFEFSQQSSVLKDALEHHEKIILKGTFSRDLADGLALFLLDRLANPGRPGFLVLMPQVCKLFDYMPQYQHQVQISEKLDLLGDLSVDIRIALEPYLSESLTQLKVRRDFIRSHPPGLSSDGAWVGIHRLAGAIQDLGTFDVRTSAADSDAFTKKRLIEVRSLLDAHHYVFLAGLSGVGKSTFVTEELCEAGDTLYTGDKHITSWARDTSTRGRKILFLDEANLSSRDWSEFEGLFNQPQTILIGGILYPLSHLHQVVFAGNPLSYGDERRLKPLFQRHGNAVLFSPLPPAVLYEKMLKPIFSDTILEVAVLEISTYILKIYSFLCACSTTDVLISPRELQMMALLICSYLRRHSGADPALITVHIAYQLSAHLVPIEYRALFDQSFKPTIVLAHAPLPDLQTFMITPSREPLRNQLDDWLSLREYRQTHAAILSPEQRYGGLGGILIEGLPSLGKSELIIATLRSRGYCEGRDFYSMPVSMPVSEKEVLLRKAFDEGAVVIIDEINSAPMMERLLNDLLMGKTPENQRAKLPGFMIIGTQNPVTMAGRRAQSTALSRRLCKVTLLDYPLEEIQSILEAEGLPANQAKALGKAFKKQVDYAREHHLTPVPTLRRLLRVAKSMKEHPLDPLGLDAGLSAARPGSVIWEQRQGFWTISADPRDSHEAHQAQSVLKKPF